MQEPYTIHSSKLVGRWHLLPTLAGVAEGLAPVRSGSNLHQMGWLAVHRQLRAGDQISAAGGSPVPLLLRHSALGDALTFTGCFYLRNSMRGEIVAQALLGGKRCD